MFECEPEITAHREVAPGTYLMTLREASIAKQARPGQFVMLRAFSGMDPLLRRPFSICGRIGEDAFGVLYRVVGRGTAVLAKQRTGDRIQVLGPLGNGFQTGPASGSFILAGGGVGVAPLFFLAQTLLGQGDRTPAFLAGFSGKQEVLSPGDVLQLDLEAEIATEDGTLGHAGPVTDLLEPHLAVCAEQGNKTTVCACGPPAMLERVAALARAAGASCQVSLESAMACGLGACLGCTVHAAPQEGIPYLRVCREGPVFPAEAVDWSRAGAGWS
ncbi:MAG: dihydroorotate dehydrogenase electron transfer subunit [Deltaproteobacteria bacterium]|nr:dihydroorotate dehydrogenase electron transfer subunit [Deltaproteobacteria bacterium]